MRLPSVIQALGATAIASLALGGSSFAQAVNQIDFSFNMVPSATPCGQPKGFVTITHDLGPTSATGLVENMHVVATGLPANTDFDFFVIQVPNAPFGLAWYMGDMLTDAAGVAVGDFYGRFQIGTFAVALGVAPAPDVLSTPPFPDAINNPTTNPVQLYHLGLWFDSPADAVKAGCPNKTTPFNSTHNAGVQILNTSNFTGNGPLFFVHR
jgi:hypothetical protein